MANIVGFRRKVITFAAGNLTQKVESDKIFSHQIEIYPASGNSGSVYIGNKDVDNTWIPRAKNTYTVFTSSEKGDTTAGGDYFDLSQVYVNGTAADVVTIQYLAIEKGV